MMTLMFSQREIFSYSSGMMESFFLSFLYVYVSKEEIHIYISNVSLYADVFMSSYTYAKGKSLFFIIT